MSIGLFTILMITFGVGGFAFFRRRLSEYFNNIFYLFLGILFVSNLGYPHSIQLMLRCLAVGLPWIYLLVEKNGKIKLKSSNQAKLMLIYVFLCLISTAWSVSPIQTLFKSLELLTDVMVIWILYSSEENRNDFIIKTINLLMGAATCLLTVTMTGFFLVPSYFANRGYSASHTILGIRIGDGLIGANQTGAIAVLVFAWAILLIYKKNILVYAALLISIIAMLFSQSRGSLILVPVILFLRLFKPKAKYTIFYVLAIVGILAVAVKNIDLLYSYIMRGQSASDLTSLSGRKMIWGYAFKYINKRPILGYGFGVGGEMVGQILPGAFKGFQHMHNGIVETLLGTGIIGCAFILLQYVYVCIKVALRVLTEGFKNSLYDIILIAFFAIRTYTSLGIGSWQSLEIILWYVFLLVMSSKKTNIQEAFKRERMRG